MTLKPFTCQNCSEPIANDLDGLVAYDAFEGYPQTVHARCVSLAAPTRVALLNVRVSALHVLRNFLRSRGDTPQALADALPWIIRTSAETA
jgi:hypothetical protein